jgi:1-hydroxycarotenoid 3,4-desaturase
MSNPALREHRVVVVGAGVGGLVSALLLANRGLQVTLVEAAATPGGKMRQVWVDGAAIDAGPTVFTMRWVFDQILAEVGSTLDELVQLSPLSVLARHAWRGHADTLDLFADQAQSAQAIGRFSGAAEARRFLAFCAQAQKVYRQLEGPYIRSERPSFLSMVRDLGPRGLATLAGLGPMASLWNSLRRHFHDPRLQQLFGRYATYCGASPWQAPATLMLVAQVEMDGVWAVQGGMHALARALAGVAQAQGVHLRYGQPCEQIVVEKGRACAVQLTGGERLPADAVVFNGDANALASGLLGPAACAAASAVPVQRRSLSAVTWAMHTQTSGFELQRHNVFFDDDYRSEFDDIFLHRRLPGRGTVYVCAQDRGDALPGQVSPAGPERLLCLVNAPADGDTRAFDAQESDPCESRSLALLRQCGLTLRPQAHQVLRTTPADFHRLFPGTGGALYGPATHGWMSAFQKAGSASPLPGLYLAGGSVHPGPGVPMAAMSGRLAAATLMAHLDSTKRSHRVVISGGMSTPSATAGNTACPSSPLLAASFPLITPLPAALPRADPPTLNAAANTAWAAQTRTTSAP